MELTAEFVEREYNNRALVPEHRQDLKLGFRGLDRLVRHEETMYERIRSCQEHDSEIHKVL